MAGNRFEIARAMVDTRPLAIALMGPTASGKSALALEWAERLGGEIVSVDSALVYRGLDIGAAKPTAGERARVPHHLLDLRDPWQAYSAAEFARDARAAIDSIVARGRLPILAGGTGLYFRALLHGLAAMPASDPALRARIAQEAEARGWAALHAELATVDPTAAARIHATDAQRIQRALEVFMLTGQPLSTLHAARAAPPLGPTLTFALMPADRARLHRAIAQRFEAMLKLGLIDEVKALRKKYRLNAALPSMRAVGYRQVWDYLDGLDDYDAMRFKGIAATRQLAKRQLTQEERVLLEEFEAEWSKLNSRG